MTLTNLSAESSDLVKKKLSMIGDPDSMMTRLNSLDVWLLVMRRPMLMAPAD